MKNIFITGVSGTGKTVISEALKDRGINAIDMDQLNTEESLSGVVDSIISKINN